METIQAIFAQLGVDSSLLPQFIIVVLVFILASVLFLNKLQFVLENREEKTVKLETSADSTLDKVNKMASEHKTKIDQAHKESLSLMAGKKTDVMNKHNDSFRKVEKEINQFIEENRVLAQKQIQQSREKLKGDVSGLAGDLVNKIVQ
jgi:F0F1-type ATP synthase membrane subunit b/b'